MDNIVIIIITSLISIAVGIFIGTIMRKKIAESKIQSAESEAKRLVDMAKIEADNLKKEEIFKAKEEIMNSRKELDQEIKERRGEIQKQEARIIQKEETKIEEKKKKVETNTDLKYEKREAISTGEVNKENIEKREKTVSNEVTDTISELDSKRLIKSDILKAFAEIENKRNKYQNRLQEISKKKEESDSKIKNSKKKLICVKEFKLLLINMEGTKIK